MLVLFPMCLTALALIAFSRGDEMPLLNAYEILRASGMGHFLPPSGTHFIADQEKLGVAALPVAWTVWVVVAMLMAWAISRAWEIIR